MESLSIYHIIRLMKDLKLKEIEGETIETKWDAKRIVIGLTVLAFLVSLGALVLFPNKKNYSGTVGGGALGVSSDEGEPQKEVPSFPTKEDIEQILRETKTTISQITTENVTSSEAAIQKLITNLEVLQGKKDARDVICDLVCKDK